MKTNFFSFLKRKKFPKQSELGIKKTPSIKDRIATENLARFNQRLDAGIKRFAKAHRVILSEKDFYVLHEAAAQEISAERIAKFLYGKDKEKIHVFFQKNHVCLRRKNALFVITCIECLLSGKANISYRTKVPHHAVEIKEHKEFV